MSRTLLITIFVQALTSVSAFAQAPAFEVAIIKENKSGNASSGAETSPGGRVTITNETLRQIIQGAYGQLDLEIIGGPSWLDSDKWDIAAVGVSGNADQPNQQMMQRLLANRFKLSVHADTRKEPVFALVVARADKVLGPSLRASTVECSLTNPCGTRTLNATMRGTGRTMADLARSLYRYAERRVLDETGLTGRYDFDLNWTDVTIFTALQEQLGLKLESRTRPVQTIVIDHVERPTPD